MARQRFLFFALCAVAALLLPLRVPMILPAEYGNNWKDVWLWQAFSQPEVSGFRPAYVPSDSVPLKDYVELAPVRRWDAVAEREAGLALLCYGIYLLAFRFRSATYAAGLLFASNPEKGFLALFLFSIVPLLCIPPCQLVRTYGGYEGLARIQRIDSSYLPLWSRGLYQIDYGALLIEIFALAACFGAGYLIFCAIRAMMWKHPD